MTGDERTPRPLIGLLALAVIIALVGALFFGVWSALAHLKSTTATAVITASATVLVSVASLILSKRWEQRLAIAEAQRDHKRTVYEGFMQFWFRILASGTSDEPAPDEEEIRSFNRNMNQKLILWGSDDLLRSYNQFRRTTATESPTESPAIILAWEQVLYAMRRDLGHRNKGLAARDLLRIFIDDVDQ